MSYNTTKVSVYVLSIKKCDNNISQPFPPINYIKICSVSLNLKSQWSRSCCHTHRKILSTAYADLYGKINVNKLVKVSEVNFWNVDGNSSDKVIRGET